MQEVISSKGSCEVGKQRDWGVQHMGCQLLALMFLLTGIRTSPCYSLAVVCPSAFLDSSPERSCSIMMGLSRDGTGDVEHAEPLADLKLDLLLLQLESVPDFSSPRAAVFASYGFEWANLSFLDDE